MDQLIDKLVECTLALNTALARAEYAEDAYAVCVSQKQTMTEELQSANVCKEHALGQVEILEKRVDILQNVIEDMIAKNRKRVTKRIGAKLPAPSMTDEELPQ